MSKLLKIFVFSFVFFFANQASAERITDFKQTIDLQKDASMIVTEEISYDFGSLDRHGIYRDITYKYKARGGNYNLRLDVISVKDKQANDYKYSVSNQGDDKRIKIGDADKTVSGQKTYIIKYKLDRAINFFDDRDELYWNVTGNKWPVEIDQSKATIVFPEVLDESSLEAVCYTGAFASDDNCVSQRYVYAGQGKVKQVVFIDDVLRAGEGLTIAVSIPKGFVAEPTLVTKVIDIAKDNWIIVLPFVVFFYMFRLWQEKGRDVPGRGVVVAQFDAPDKLSPMGVGTIVDTRADNRDFSANLISLAVKGYLKIVKVQSGKIFKKDDYALVSLDSSEELRESEKTIKEKLFQSKYLNTDSDKLTELESDLTEGSQVVFLSDLKQKFYTDLSKIKQDIKKELTAAGYFDKQADKRSIKFILIGVLVFMLGFLFIAMNKAIFAISVIASGVIIFVFAILMPRRTEKGSLAKEHVDGLKKYLEVAEKDRLDFHNAPEKNPKTFEKLLPYAIALGVEKKWAKQFEGIYDEVQPSWYSSYDGRAFSAIALADSVSSFATTANAASSSAPSSASSGGSGFSGGGVGGGFGGGGGGSW